MTKSPTLRLLVGLLVTLAAVTGFSALALHELHALRRLQKSLVDLNRHESLQLLQVQSDLNTVDLKLRDLTSEQDGVSLARYRGEFDSLQQDLNRALEEEDKLGGDTRGLRRAQLTDSFARFWQNLDAVFDAVAAGNQAAVTQLVEQKLVPLQADLAAQVSSLLERNNAVEAQLDDRISKIYENASRDIYGFLLATMLTIAATSLYLIYSNRKFFEQLESLSLQRRVLAGRLFTVQEEVLRSVSRELHDEFGQILTAVGAMLARAEKKGVPPGSPLRTELTEVREITQNTLEKIRSLSQMLHPSIIDDYGLVKAIEWYTDVFERQNGVAARTQILGAVQDVGGPTAIHCLRIVQEALTNTAKHSAASKTEVTVEFGESNLLISVRDNGRGISSSRGGSSSGLGLLAMRERAQLLNGTLQIDSAVSEGTTVKLTVPLPALARQAADHDARKVLVERI